MVTPFGEQLRTYLQEQRLRQEDFAQAVGVSQPYVSLVLNGKRPPPEEVEPWADALRLRGRPRQDFLLAADLRRSPPRVREHVERLERWTARSRQRG